MKMLFKIVHCFLEYFVRPILHKFGYDLVVEPGWVPEKKRDWALMSSYHDLIASYCPAKVQDGEMPKIIWQFWWQGVSHAPEIVKRCMESVRHFMGSDYEIIVIDKDNIDQFVVVNDVIRLRHEAGEMSHTHFSDYLRAKLLSERGGVWIDATVFLSARIPDEILNARYFTFKTSLFSQDSEIPTIENLNAMTEFLHGTGRMLSSSWFLVAKPGSPINSIFVLFEEEYWKKERRLYNYYLYHMLTTYAVVSNQYCRDEFVSAPLYLNIKPHLLMFRREERAIESAIENIFSMSTIHKMTYKYVKFQEQDKSLLGKLLSGELLEHAKRDQRRLRQP